MKTNICYQGDCLDVIKTLPENSVDSIVTDPPYELGFMGKSWDNTGIANNPLMWAECLRVLKPGGHLLSFSGTRTYHRMAVAIEDAGFEIRDMIEWVYGSGFPKSLNIGKAVDKLQGNEREVLESYKVPDIKGDAYGTMNEKQGGSYKNIEVNKTKGTSQWEGWGTALKPSHEPICMARKPLAEKTVAKNVLKYGTGGINIDESRVDYQSEADKASATPQGKCTSNTSAGSAPDVDMSEVDYNGERYWYKNEYKWLVDKWLNDEDYVWSELKENLETYDWCKVPEIDNGDRVLFDSGEGVCIRLYESKRKEFVRPEQLGRFPANLIHDNSEEVRECFPDTKTGAVKTTVDNGANQPINLGGGLTKERPSDSGNASRFFKSIIYQAKASKSERNKNTNNYLIIEICVDNTEVAQLQPRVILEKTELWFTELFGKEKMEEYQMDFKSTIKTETKKTTILATLNYSQHLNIKEYIVGAIKTKMESGGNPVVSVENTNEWKQIIIKELTEYLLGVNPVVSPTQLRISVNANNFHSTVKPIALMSYLIKMITPKGGIVLDPFAGSGSTLVAAKENGFQYVGIELTEEYLPIIQARTGCEIIKPSFYSTTRIDQAIKEQEEDNVKLNKELEDMCLTVKTPKNICPNCGGKLVKTKYGKTCEDCLNDY